MQAVDSKRALFARTAGSILVAAALGGCQGLPAYEASGADYAPALAKSKVLSGLVAAELRKKADNVERRILAEAVAALEANDLLKASELLNAALKLNVSSSELHLLNALTYHLMALLGDTARFEMAEEGYKVALRFDPTHWLAEYQLGLCYLDQRKYRHAQQHLARAAAIDGRDTDLLYDLAVASYYAHDPRIAEGALKRIGEIAPLRAASAPLLRAGALVRAAMNDHEGARRLAGDARKLLPAEEAADLARRLDDWEFFYRAPAVQPVQFTPGPVPGLPGGFPPPPGGFGTPGAIGAPPQPFGAPPPGFQPQPGTPGAGAGPFVDDKMVVVDVVLIGTQEDARETYGVNLLNGLRIQFGDSLTNTPASSWTTNNVSNAQDRTLDTQTFTVTRHMRIPSISYSLNIANAFNARNEVIAKPSLVALAGQASDFFSGTEISAAAVSGGAGDSVTVNKEVGIKLAVRPDFLPDGKIRLQVAAQRTFLTDPSRSVVFQFRLDTSKTNVNANVVMRYGETLVLSGLVERETSNGNDGVPVLRDIPGLNLLFAQRDTRDFRKSILILLTPRRPIYGAQSPEERQAVLDSLNEYERSIARLENRHKDWFLPRSIMEEAREKIDPAEVYREFRSGDLKSERWDRRDVHGERVRRAVERLFI